MIFMDVVKISLKLKKIFFLCVTYSSVFFILKNTDIACTFEVLERLKFNMSNLEYFK
jgi:hypothetical protein